jgi:hypothetical protein
MLSNQELDGVINLTPIPVHYEVSNGTPVQESDPTFCCVRRRLLHILLRRQSGRGQVEGSNRVWTSDPMRRVVVRPGPSTSTSR